MLQRPLAVSQADAHIHSCGPPLTYSAGVMLTAKPMQQSQISDIIPQVTGWPTLSAARVICLQSDIMQDVKLC